MTSPTAPDAPRTALSQRPISPYFIYKPQITSVLALFHRLTCLGLAGGLVMLVAWLSCLALGKSSYDLFMDFVSDDFGETVLFVFSAAFFFHFFESIRRLIWDAGWFVTNSGVAKTGYAALAIAAIIISGVWAKVEGIL